MNTNSLDNGAWALALCLQVLGISSDPFQLYHNSGKTSALDYNDLLRLSLNYPVKSKTIIANIKKLHKIALPTIACLKNGDFCVIGQFSNEGVLIQGATNNRPLLISLNEFDEMWSGRLILITRRASISSLHRRFDILWFWGAINKYKGILYEVLGASFFLQIFSLVTPLIFQVVIDKVLVHRSLSTLEVLIAALAFVALFEAILGGLRMYLFSHTSNRIDVELGSRVYKHLINLPLAYFQARRVGDSVARVRELETIRQFITSSALTLVLDLFFGIVFIGVLFLYSSVLAWIVVATVPFYMGLAAFLTPIFRTRLDDKFNKGAENQAYLVETVTGIETIKAMAVEPTVLRLWEEQMASYVTASFRTQIVANFGNNITTFLSKFTTAIILFIGAKLVINNELTVGELVAFNMLSNQVIGPVLRLAQIWQDFHQVKISVDRLGDILNSSVEPKPTSGGGDFGQIRGDIVLKNLTFRYRPDTQPVLTNVNLEIPAGQILGVVGASGSGKSTIAKLIQRLYVPESGQVLIDGYDISLVDPAWLRRQIGVVLQENMLFNKSIRENIALANPAIPIDVVIAAAELAGAHEFITKMPRGYDTIIGERGTSLSGGQRQRIAIARALIGNPRILIFDEATSALDYESESIIQKNMKQIVAGRTVIIIAHRLSTVRSADRIITIDSGQIIEEGTHEELLLANGRYAYLHSLQEAPDQK